MVQQFMDQQLSKGLAVVNGSVVNGSAVVDGGSVVVNGLAVD